MLVAISGSQSAGKSTIIEALEQRGYQTVNRKTSRSILSDWNVTLQEVNLNQDLTIRFQNEIIKRKFEDEQVATHSDEIWFTERTFADLFVYALVTLGKDNEYNHWLSNYYKQCIEYQQSYDQVYYLKAGFFNVVHDGTRGSGRHYSRMVDLTMLDFTQQMTHVSKLTVIDTPDLEERIELIIQQTIRLNKQRR